MKQEGRPLSVAEATYAVRFESLLSDNERTAWRAFVLYIEKRPYRPRLHKAAGQYAFLYYYTGWCRGLLPPARYDVLWKFQSEVTRQLYQEL